MSTVSAPIVHTLEEEIVIRSIKILDIGYIAAIYFLFALVICMQIDKYMGTFDQKEEDKKSLARVIANTVLYMWLIGVVIYIVRNLAELIPFPLDGVYGFKHSKVKELGNATVFVFIFMQYQLFFKNRLTYLFTRIQAGR
jgi:hypothetical protein